MLEAQAHEVEPWRTGDDTACVARISIGVEHVCRVRDLDEAEVRIEAGAPDDGQVDERNARSADEPKRLRKR